MSAVAQPHQPRLVSNDVDDFEQGGLYPGGTGTAKFRYTLWDYAGTMEKDSVVAVRMDFTPTDGSNEGKPVTEYFSCGNAKDFSPSTDGGCFLWAISSANQIRNNTNWHFFAEKMKTNCGLPRGAMGQDKGGLAALDGVELTLTRVDSPARDTDGMPAMPPIPGQTAKKKYKSTILIPTRAVFPWDRNKAGARPPAPMAAPVATAAPAPAPAPAPVGVAAPPAPPAPPSAPAGAPSANVNWQSVLPAQLEAMVTNAGGMLVVADVLKEIVAWATNTGVPAKDRVEMLKALKAGTPFTELAAAKAGEGWTFDGTTLSMV